jgi:hypothetical protein
MKFHLLIVDDVQIGSVLRHDHRQLLVKNFIQACKQSITNQFQKL